MKLSWKMTLIFTIMMLAALFSMSMYASELTVNGANAFTKALLFSMSSSIQRSLEQDVSMMSITMQELTENTSFMAALNQMVRDDSTDQKVGTAAAAPPCSSFCSRRWWTSSPACPSTPATAYSSRTTSTKTSAWTRKALPSSDTSKRFRAG